MQDELTCGGKYTYISHMTTNFMLVVESKKVYISGDSVNFGKLVTYTGNLDLHVFHPGKDNIEMCLKCDFLFHCFYHNP